MSGASDDPLRRQVEQALADAGPPPAPRTPRWAVVAAGALGLSLLVNLLVVFAPGSVGLAPSSDLDALRDRVVGLEQPVAADGTTSALETTMGRLDRLERRVGVSLPGLCATLGELGDWSWLTGAPPDPLCPPAADAR